MVTQTPVKTISPEEYLAQEELATERHEYIRGEGKLMTPNTIQHCSISGNLMVILVTALKKQQGKRILEVKVYRSKTM